MKSIALREARQRAGLTQDALAHLADVPQSVISRLESGEADRPAFATVMKLAKALKLSPEKLTFGKAVA